MEQRDIIKVRVHDGIVGLLYLASIALANQFGLDWDMGCGRSCSITDIKPFY